MAYLRRKKSGFYIVEKIQDGQKWKERWVKIGNVPLTQARAVLVRYQSDNTYLRLGLLAPRKIPFCELCTEFHEHQKKFTDKKPETLDRERRFLRVIEQKFGQTLIHKFDHEDFMEWCSERKYKPKTVWHYVGAVRLAFKFAVERGYIEKNPTDKIRKPRLIKNPPKHIDEETLWLLMECFTPSTKPIFQIMLYTGLRPLECCQLRTRNVNLKKMVLDLHPEQTKTAERGLIPIHQALVPVFQKLLSRKKGEDFLFPANSGSGHRIDCKKSLNDATKKLFEKHKIKVHVTPYQFRHTFATRLLNKTGDIRVVQQLMRHKSIQMTTRYATALDSRLRDAIDNF